MATLTGEQLDDIRLVVGDSCSDPLVADATVQTWYDATPDCMAQVYVNYLQRLWAKAVHDPKNLVTLANAAVNVKASSLEKLVVYWSKDPCVSTTMLATLTTGTLVLGIDTTEDNYATDLENGW